MGRKIQITTNRKDQETTIMERFKDEARAEILENIEEETQKMKEKAEKEISEMKRKAELELEEREQELERKEKDMKNKIRKERKQWYSDFMQEKEKAEEEIKQEWEKIESENQKNIEELKEKERKLEKVVEEVEKKIELINEQIRNANLATAEYKMLNDENEHLKKILEKYKHEIDLIKKGKLIQNNGESVQLEDSIYDGISKKNITKIGQITLGEDISKEKFKKLSSRYKKEQIFSDGILLENGDKISIIVVPSKDEKNRYEFYSNIPVITKYNLLCIANFCLQLHKVGVEVPEENKGITLEHFLYSNGKTIGSENCTYQMMKPNMYNMKYSNNQFLNYGLLALAMHSDLDCSKKNISKEQIKEVENGAVTESMKLLKNCELIDEIDSVDKTVKRQVYNGEDVEK